MIAKRPMDTRDLVALIDVGTGIENPAWMYGEILELLNTGHAASPRDWRRSFKGSAYWNPRFVH